MNKDKINNPEHYTFGNIEPIDAIEDWQLNHHRASAVQYIVRAGRKSKTREVDDLKKAIWYLQRDVKLLEKVNDRTLSLFDEAEDEKSKIPDFPQDYLKKNSIVS